VNDIWVCDSCKSINRRRDAHCYRCRASRTGAMETPGLDLRAESAALERSVRSYLISWPLAVITVALLVAVAVLGLVILQLQANDFPALKQAFVTAITSGRESVDQSLVTQSVQLGLFALVRSGLTLLALLCFAAWLALVTRNVPLLGGGTPSRSPVRVFIYTLIPIWNLIKVPGIIQDLLYRVDPEGGGAFMVLAAWIGLVGSYFVSLIGSWVITAAGVRAIIPKIEAGDISGVTKVFADVLDQGFWLGVVVALMVAAGTILLGLIMIRIESRSAARDREIRAQTRATGSSTPPAGPDSQPVSPPASDAEGASVPTAVWRTRIDPTQYYHSPSAPSPAGRSGLPSPSAPGAQPPAPPPGSPPPPPSVSPPPPPPNAPRIG